MQLHRSEGATRPPVSPTAWLTSWVDLEDSDTATLYRPMWGPRRLAVGSDTAQCERHTRCVYIATISLIITLQPHSFAKRNWQLHIFFCSFPLQDQRSPWSDTVESVQRKYRTQSISSQTLTDCFLMAARELPLFIVHMCFRKWNNYN